MPGRVAGAAFKKKLFQAQHDGYSSFSSSDASFFLPAFFSTGASVDSDTTVGIFSADLVASVTGAVSAASSAVSCCATDAASTDSAPPAAVAAGASAPSSGFSASNCDKGVVNSS